MRPSDAVRCVEHGIDGIVISHEHSDHIGGLAHLLAEWRTTVYLTAATHAEVLRNLSEKQAKRFDRIDGDGKLHMQSLAAMGHFDFNNQSANSYEQALLTMRRIGLPMAMLEEQFRRMIFNVIARNQDDHVKNIAFLMDREGAWSLAPAYDVIWAWKPGNLWLDSHQMSINGKRDGFTIADLRAVAAVAGLKRGRAEAILGDVVAVVARWGEVAEQVGIEERMAEQIERSHRLDLPAG